jgi:serine/threonine protein kinase
VADSDDREADRERLITLLERIGQVGGRFSDLGRLGDGGASGNFSALLSGVDGETGQRVALKFLLPIYKGTYRESAFHREVALLEEFRGCPDIIQLVAPTAPFRHLFRSAEGIDWPWETSYYALELARTDVGAIIANVEWGAEELLLAFRTMCRGVQRLHSRGVADRDLKPSNFLVVGRATVKLSDLGGGRLLDSRTPALGRYVGPPGDRRYSAPELHGILHEEWPEIAFKSDFFSLGAICFEMFAGTVLGPRIYDEDLLGTLQEVMMNVRVGKRRAVFDGFVSELADSNQIPSVGTFAQVPGCILQPVDNLVQSLAALDYRKRLCDFASVFNRVDRCLLIVRHEAKVQRWLLNKRRRREARFLPAGS